MNTRYYFRSIIVIVFMLFLMVGCSSTTLPYLIEFETNGGSDVPSIPTNGKSLISLPLPPSKPGYSFLGWYLDDTLFTMELTEEYLVTHPTQHNIKVYALWELTQFTITYHTNGGVNDSNNPILYTFDSDSIALTAPVQEHYDFKGWYSHPHFLGEAITSIPKFSSGNLSLYARFELQKFFIHYYSVESYRANIDYVLHFDEQIIGVYAGASHSGALTSKGRLFMWGDNYYGQNADGNLDLNRTYPVEITPLFGFLDGEMIIDVSLGFEQSAAITSKGRIFIWGTSYYEYEGVHRWTVYPLPYDLTPWISLSTDEWIVDVELSNTGDHYAVLTSNGRVFMVGPSESLPFNNPTTDYYYTPEDVTSSFSLFQNEYVTQVLIFGRHSAVLTSNNRLLMWGDNLNGQLGDGTTKNSKTPVDVTANLHLSTDEKILIVSLGLTHSMISTSFGRVLMWGQNSNTILGDGTTSSILIPKDITSYFGFLEDEVVVRIMNSFACSTMVTSKNRMFRWGSNIGPHHCAGPTNQTSIYEISSSFLLGEFEDFIAFSSGTYHSIALTSENRIFTWGRNNEGQLGNSTLVDEISPTLVSSILSPKVISSASYSYGVSYEFFKPVKDGYTFMGWYEDPFYNTLYIHDTMPSKNLILYAKWVEVIIEDK
ncbi:MAG: InlB B-repeat-containing protein [Candidatus Izemoplasmatales bacterium]|nr:InlB B-repeat-containing protein [Candidatus Izemoplasmatales bacterium]